MRGCGIGDDGAFTCDDNMDIFAKNYMNLDPPITTALGLVQT